MCLAVPGKIVKIDATGPMKMGQVDFGGVQREVCLEWIPEVSVGQYVIVHVGFAISVMDELEAQKTLDLLREMDSNALDELGTPPPNGPS